jgi:cytochrome c oxidase subunit 1
VSARSFWRRHVFSTDHKVIGVQYAVSGLLFLLFGFCLVLLIRWQLAYPGRAMPVIGGWFSGDRVAGGAMLPGFYNELGAMHGTIMVFLGVVPILVGGFGNYLLPLQIGAADMAFPRLNMASFWVFLSGGLLLCSSFLLPGGAAQSGWTSYPPLAVIAPHVGQDVWIVGMVFIITSSLLGAVNFIVTTVQLRAPGMHMFRMPYFVWTQLVTAFILLLSFPPLEAAGVLMLADRLLGTSFYLPAGLLISGRPLPVSGGGSPILWQHLFWFLGHPEVYVMLLPALGIVCDILATNSRKPLYGYRGLVYSVVAVGLVSFVVWAHHMYATDMGLGLTTFFQFTTMVISLPSALIVLSMMASLWGGSLRFPVAMLFALAFLFMFGIGGLTGLPLGLAGSDLHLHDTYYVVGHFHYVVAGGILFGIFAGIYHWYPKVTGRCLSVTLGRLHFAATLVAMNAIFFPMFIQGFAGVSRRLFDPTQYAHARAVQPTNVFITWAAGLLFLGQLPFIWSFFASLFAGERAGDNPWQATTLEWATTSPPPEGNFAVTPRVHHGPYEYSRPDMDQDYLPQNVESAAGPEATAPA